MIKLYFHATSKPLSVALMLEELGAEYENVHADFAANAHVNQPGMEDDGRKFFDSNAIVLHLAQKHGRFLANAQDMSEMWSWFFFIVTGIAPRLDEVSQVSRAVPFEARCVDEIMRRLKVLNDRLAASAHLGGANYSFVDIAAWGWVRMATVAVGPNDCLATYPHLQTWIKTLNARPAARRAEALLIGMGIQEKSDTEAMRAMFPQNF